MIGKKAKILEIMHEECENAAKRIYDRTGVPVIVDVHEVIERKKHVRGGLDGN